MAIEHEGDLFGLAVYLAARVTGHAHGGEILLTQAARDLVAQSQYRFEAFGPTLLQGFEEPVPIYDLKWNPDGDQTSR
jgi:class 3 adenylate cyclase